MEDNLKETAQSISVKKHIVVFGKHDYILKNVEDLLQKSDFTSVGFVNAEEARDYVRMNPVDGILIGGGVSPHDRQDLKDLVKSEFTHIKVIEHFGGPATIMTEVLSAFNG